MTNTWRDKARPIIAKVLADHAGEDEKTICAALKDAYPFGLRQYHPYKIWCDEIRIQLGKRKFGAKKKEKKVDENQQKLF